MKTFETGIEYRKISFNTDEEKIERNETMKTVWERFKKKIELGGEISPK